MEPKANKASRALRLFVLAALVLIMTAAPMGQALSLERVVDTADFANIGSTSNFYWAGYTFTVNTPVVVTSLYGGHSGADSQVFFVGLYRAPALDLVGQSAEEVLAFGHPTPGERFDEVEIHPVLLEPGEVYLLAQGRHHGLSGLHYTLGRSIDTTALSVNHIHIDQWGPLNGDAYTFGASGDQDTPLNTQVTGIVSNYRPHLGLGDLFPAV
jgi:hypothetical protein